MLEKIKALERLKHATWEWLVLHDLEMDTRFYSIEDWRVREEPYHNDADLVLIFEGSLHTILNFGGDTDVFDDLVESFGFYYELGHSWNMGFYPIDDYNYSITKDNYSVKLQDNRWKKKSLLVKKRANGQCEDCGIQNSLEAHHSYYQQAFYSFEPWEYPLDSFRCLCRKCHQQRHKEEIRIRSYLSKYSTNQLIELRGALDNATYWLKGVQNMLELLNSIKNSRQEFISYVQRLLVFDK